MDIEHKETFEEHLKSGQPSANPDYLAWKEQEVLAALEEAKDRLNMIPAHKVWKEFGLEH